MREHSSVARRRAAAAMAAIGLVLCATASSARDPRTRARGANDAVAVEVVEVAGGHAYLSAGEDEGVRAGSVVTIRADRYRVVAATRTHAVVALGERGPREGDRGRASVVRGDAVTEGPPPRPAGLSRYRGQWPRAVRPASRQTPRAIPLGRVTVLPPTRVLIGHRTTALVPLESPSDAVVWTELGGRARGVPAAGFGFDAEAIVRLELARGLLRQSPASERPVVLVRAAEVQLGTATVPLLRAGRLRAAAANLGMLDGARVQAPPLGPLRVAAFGGAIPDAVTTEPALDGGRFGVEAALAHPDVPGTWLTIVAHGSSFQGALDERRLSIAGLALPGPLSIGAAVEVAAHDAENPWGAPAVELGAASTDVAVDAGALRLGARLDLERPERSRWLDARLSPSWSCARAAAEPACEGPGPTRLGGTMHASVLAGGFAAFGGVSAGVVAEDGELEEVAAFGSIRGSGIAGVLRLELGASAVRTSFEDVASVRPAIGATLLGGALDVDLFARPVATRPFAQGEFRIDPGGGVEVRAAPHPALDLGLYVDASAGPGVDALIVVTTASWRPD